jgi:hypothetical protein
MTYNLIEGCKRMSNLKNRLIDVSFVILSISVVAIYGRYLGLSAELGTGNQSFYLLLAAIPVYLIFAKTFRDDLARLSQDKLLLFSICVLALYRFMFSSNMFVHALYHGPIYVSEIGTFHWQGVPYGFTWRLFWQPLTQFLGKSGPVIFMGNNILNIMSGYLVYLILEKITKDKWAGYIGLWLFSISPVQARYAGTECFLILSLFLELLIFYCVLKQDNERNYSLFTLSFVVLACLTFVRPEHFYVFPLFCFTTLLYMKHISIEKKVAYLLFFFLLIINPLLIPLRTTIPLLLHGRTPSMTLAYIFPHDTWVFKIKQILTPFASRYFILPFYFVATFAGCYLLWCKQYRKIVLVLLAYYIYCILITPLRFTNYSMVYLYLCHLEFVPIILASIMLYHMVIRHRTKKFISIALVLMLILSCLQIALNFGEQRMLYQEQREYKFFMKYYPSFRDSVVTTKLNDPECDKIKARLRDEKHHLLGIEFEDWMIDTGSFSFEEIHPVLLHSIRTLLGGLGLEHAAVRTTGNEVIYFRNLCHGFSEYDASIARLGLIPIKILRFPFHRNYDAYPEGESMTIGFYRFSNPPTKQEA